MHGRPHWLNRERLRVYPRLMLAVFAALGIAWLCLPRYRPIHSGTPMGDFVVFWTASRMAAAGHAADAYSMPLLLRAQAVVFPRSEHVYAWFYPPTFFLLIRPLAQLPFAAAFALFNLSTLGLYVLVFRRITREQTAMWCLAAFSGMWVNLLNGQNAFLTAALAAGAILCLRKRPAVAGVLVGLLAIKPHLALLFPVALVAIGAWSTLLIAALTAVAFTAVSTAVLGTATLKAFLATIGQAKIGLETGLLNLPKMPTVYGSLRLLGAPLWFAYATHAVFALGAAFAVWHVWRRSSDWRLRGAVLMSATFFISPYVFDYDLAWLAFPIVWLALNGLEHGWLGGEREVLAAAWLLPLLMPLGMEQFHLQLGPPVLLALVWVSLRRVRTPATAANRNDEGVKRARPEEYGLLPAR